MAANADSVVVELIAKNDQFDANVRQSSAAYQQGMRQIETAAGGAEKAHGRMTLAMNNNRVAMLEFQHIARGTADQLAAGAPLTQVLAQHMGMLGQAVGLAGGSLGSLGAFLSGPWGLALTVAATGIAMLIARHKDESDTVEAVLQKRMKMHEQTLLNKEADEAWSHTLSGLIEGLQKTNDELGKRLKLQPVVDEQSLQQANAQLLKLGQGLITAEDDPNTAPERLAKIRDAFHQAVTEVHSLTLLLGREEGQALTDLGARADQWAARQQDVIDRLQGFHPELAAFGADVNSAFALMKKAVADAAGANVPFDNVTRQVDALNNKLAEAPGGVREYVAELKKLATQLEAAAEAAKKLAKIDPVAQFKAAVIGAEGSGANRMGSSAAGIGQFMPDTWMKYFKQAYPDQAATLPREAILDLRNQKDVAVGVIDVATKDYVSVLERAGQQITAAALYTMHLLSAGDPKGRVALRLLTAPAEESTSDFLSAGVRSGNPFLSGTAGSARAAIARRIGDSSSTVSSGALAIQRELNALEDENSKKLAEALGKESEIEVVKGRQSDLNEQLLHSTTSMADLIKNSIQPGLVNWERMYERIKAGEEEVLQVGYDIIDTVLDPDNWSNWGDMAHKVLHEIELEILKLGLINPLKNLLGGSSSNLPTLFGTLSGLFGGGGGGIDSAGLISGNNAALAALAGSVPHFAGGGAIRVSGGVDTNVLSINGQARAMVSGNETIGVFPSNARAASPGAGGGPLTLRVVKGDLFDIIVEGTAARVAAPMVVQGSIAAAQGGASISRRNLGRESMHRLD
jgi:hypothetical protein